MDSIHSLRWPGGCNPDILLVDNASPEPLSSNKDIQNWLSVTPGSRIVLEGKLGLSHARIRGLRDTRGQLIVFFDDDNLPEPDYIEAAAAAATDYPFVGVWGPGVIEVIWLPGGDPAVRAEHAREFQQHAQTSVSYALEFPMPETMPFGTGMVVRREVADRYLEWHSKRRINTTGRTGSSLSSAEDIQFGWIAMLHGWAVGRHPALRLKHMVSGSRCQFNYMARARYHTAASYAPALSEVLPELLEVPAQSTGKLVGNVIVELIRWIARRGSPPLRMSLAPILGSAMGAWKARGQVPPRWARIITKTWYG